MTAPDSRLGANEAVVLSGHQAWSRHQEASSNSAGSLVNAAWTAFI